eukprot:JP448476.1.p2 GENE.JP448476.1~~JP448476.1.p2  ORF type:complete len:66 (+),score=26.71 JP448476.1:33-230(+)
MISSSVPMTAAAAASLAASTNEPTSPVAEHEYGSALLAAAMRSKGISLSDEVSTAGIAALLNKHR